jgi:MFS family permease
MATHRRNLSIASRPRVSAPTRPLLAASAVLTIAMEGTTAPTMVYQSYASQFGISALMISVIYAFYAVGVIGTLLAAGGLADVSGRRPMMIAGLIASGISDLAFLLASGPLALMIARFLSGISAGIFTGTGTATIIDLAPEQMRSRAVLAATAANMLGLGLGPLIGGIAVECIPAPLRSPYAIHMLLLCLAFACASIIPETIKPHPGSRSIQPDWRLPESAQRPFYAAASAGFAGFVVVGFFAVGAPRLARQVGLTSPMLVGAIVFLMFASSTIGQTLQPVLTIRRGQIVGCIGLIAGLVCLALCAGTPSLTSLILGTTVAGTSQGLGLRAGLLSVTTHCPENRRSGVTSLFFVCLYAALSVPVVLFGLLEQLLNARDATFTLLLLTAAMVLTTLTLLCAGPRKASQTNFH